MSQADPSSSAARGHPQPRGPGLHLQWLELRAPLEAAATLALLPLWPLAQRGDGHPVLALPGLGTGDSSTTLMRQFLDSRGWATQGWDQGLNLGFRPGVMDRLRLQLERLAHDSGRRVSLVGWSLGGVIARELAKELPQHVRAVVTLGSPFTGHPRETNAWRLYEWVSGHRIGHDDLHLPLRTTPPVPTTSIYSRTDGVVSWRCSVEPARAQAESIEVPASHLGLGLNPLVLYALADRLAQPEGAWAPFARDGWRRWLYGAPSVHHSHPH
jgi:pimeloyl-ACP methyl ester carboxylesterase